MVWGFKKSEKSSEHNLLINLKSKNISFAIFKKTENKTDILFSTSLKQKDDLIKTLNSGLQKISSTGITNSSNDKIPVKISKIKVVLAPEFYDCYIKDLVIEKDKPFILTEDQFYKSIEKHAEILGAEKSGKIVLEKDVTNVTINGYTLKNPFNKKANNLLVSFYASFVEKDFLLDIKNSIKNHFPGSKIVFKTQTLNIFNILRNVFINIPNYTSINISENYTEVFIVENGGLKYQKEFNFGYQKIIDEISQKCNLNPAIVDSEIKMSEVGELKNTCNPEIERALEKQKKIWINMLISEIVDQEGINIPPKVFLMTNKKYSDIFLKILNEPQNRQSIFRNEKDITIINCDNKHFSKYLLYKENVESDIFIAVNSINLED